MWKSVPIFAALFAVGLCGITGGWQDVSTHEEDFINSLNYAVAQHNRDNKGDTSLHMVVEIVSAQVQVVAGANYKIVVKLGRTNCQKGQPSTGCAVYVDPAEARIYQCTFKVWSCPWLNNIQVTEKKCLEPQLNSP